VGTRFPLIGLQSRRQSVKICYDNLIYKPAECCQIITKIFPSFNPLGKTNKFRGRYFNIINTISLRRGVFPFSLLMPALSLGIVLLSVNILSLVNIIYIKSKIYPMFCYPIDKSINRFNGPLLKRLRSESKIKLTYRQDVGILFRSVKFSVPLT
jgi:hypothetical protein